MMWVVASIVLVAIALFVVFTIGTARIVQAERERAFRVGAYRGALGIERIITEHDRPHLMWRAAARQVRHLRRHALEVEPDVDGCT